LQIVDFSKLNILFIYVNQKLYFVDSNYKRIYNLIKTHLKQTDLSIKTQHEKE
jgi:hypothetical protein